MRELLPRQRPLDVEDLLDLYAPTAPGLQVGFVATVDGGTAWQGGSRALQTPSDEAVFHTLRAVNDAVVVGAGTFRSEGYGPVRPRPAGRAWRLAHGRDPHPPLVVVSRSLQLDPTSRAFSGPARGIVVTCAAAPSGARAALEQVADVVVAGQDEVDLTDAVSQLADRGLTRLLCEGGPRLVTGLLAAGLVDELCLTVSPLLVGVAPHLLDAALPVPTVLHLRQVVDGGDGALLLRYGVGARPV